MDYLISSYRVLDLSDEKGCLCGKILGDLGADVIKVERPGGDPSRRLGPFYRDMPDPEKSLPWFAFNTSKRGITLNIETADGREIFKRLVKGAEFVIESYPPGYMDSLGLGYLSLSEINPRIIMTSISPFGQTGPRKDYKGSDLVALATGGLLFICGDPDRPPVRCAVELAYGEAGLQAAMGTMIAHYYRQSTGEGQHVDVSIQECILLTLWNTQHYWDLEKIVVQRLGPYVKRGRIQRRINFRCKDGYISWQLLTYQLGRRTRGLVEWMDSEGMAEDLMGVNWETVNISDVSQEQEYTWEEAFEKFFAAHSKAELHEEAVKRGGMIFPCNSTEDLLKSRQLQSRDFWQQLYHPQLDESLIYPGAPFKTSEASWRMTRPAPLIGQHNEEIYEQELGFTKDELAILKQANVI